MINVIKMLDQRNLIIPSDTSFVLVNRHAMNTLSVESERNCFTRKRSTGKIITLWMRYTFTGNDRTFELREEKKANESEIVLSLTCSVAFRIVQHTLHS